MRSGTPGDSRLILNMGYIFDVSKIVQSQIPRRSEQLQPMRGLGLQEKMPAGVTG
jgi:hypothetical protein